MLQELSVVTAALQTERRRRRWQQKNHSGTKTIVSKSYDTCFLTVGSFNHLNIVYFELQVRGVSNSCFVLCFKIKQSY